MLVLIAPRGRTPQPAVPATARGSDLSSVLSTSSTRLHYRAKVPSGMKKGDLFYSTERDFTELIRGKRAVHLSCLECKLEERVHKISLLHLKKN